MISSIGTPNIPGMAISKHDALEIWGAPEMFVWIAPKMDFTTGKTINNEDCLL